MIDALVHFFQPLLGTDLVQLNTLSNALLCGCTLVVLLSLARRRRDAKQIDDLRRANEQLNLELSEHRISGLEKAKFANLEATLSATLKNEELLRRITDALPAFVSYIDSNHVFRFANKTYENWFGKPREKILHQNVAQHLDILFFEAKRHYLDAALLGERVTFEASFVSSDKKQRYLKFDYVPDHDSNGQVRGCIALVNDITDQKQIERQLAQNARELKRSNIELEQFAYVASHDLQEPLRAVTNNCQALEAKYKKLLDSDALIHLDFAVAGARRMQSLIRGLLEYSRVDRDPDLWESVDCNSVLGDIVSNLQTSIEEANATLVCKNLPVITASSTQIGQLLQNLIGNALKFQTAQHPRIEVGAEKMTSEWRFYVRDNGIGIEEKYFERIFAIFQRLHSREAYPGTGIGLALCQKIVERHNGRIWVESKAGEGSTFFFTIPSDRRDEALASTEAVVI